MEGRILIAEDEPYIVESLTFVLRRAGFEIVSVGEGPAVLPAIREQKPVLLILDIMIPEMNGFDVLRQIRAREDLNTMAVLVLSAKGQEADRKLMADLGADAFVTKPFSNADLVDQVTALIQARVP